MAKSIYKLLWIHNLLEDLKLKHDNPMKSYCINKATCDIAHNSI
jgi:hypothetical protein